MPNPDIRIPSAKLPRVSLPGATLPGVSLPTPKNVPGEGDWERITPATQAKVWKKRFGFRKTGVCVCCHQRTIYRDDFVCGHRRAYARGGSNDVSNLEPLCGRCNRKMGTHDLESWCKQFREALQAVKPMPEKKTAKKTVRKTTARKPAAKAPVAKKTVRRTTAKKTAKVIRTAKKKVSNPVKKKSMSKRTRK
jgi:hypothetical protein